MRVEILGEFDENFCLIKGDQAEVWGQNYSSHRYKVRDYKPHFVGIITREEALALADAKVEAEEKAVAEREATANEETARAERLAALAGEYHGLFLTARGEIEDRYGNYFFSIPKDIPPDIGEYIRVEAEKYFPASE